MFEGACGLHHASGATLPPRRAHDPVMAIPEFVTSVVMQICRINLVSVLILQTCTASET
jgi:hypothetical protein